MAVGLIAAVLSVQVAARADTASSGAAATQAAETILEQMGHYVGSAAEFTVHADLTFDRVAPSGQMVEVFATQDVAVRRSGGLYVDYQSDLGGRQFWYDGQSVTLLTDDNTYVTAPMAGDLDSMLHRLIAALDFAPPLVDFIFDDPAKALESGINSGVDLGETTVAGVSCDHLAFIGPTIDWQIWVADGAQMVPLKIAITYKDLPDKPRFAAVLSDWDFAPRIADPLFQARIPADAQRVTFRPDMAGEPGK